MDNRMRSSLNDGGSTTGLFSSGSLGESTASLRDSARKWIEFAKSLKLELILFLLSMSFSMRYVVTQELFVVKSCILTENHTESECKSASSNASLSTIQEANTYSVYLVLAQFIPSIILSVFMSSWCDIHGHKIPVFFVLAGTITMEVGTIFTVIYIHLPLYVNVLCGLISGLTGGIVAMSTMVHSAASKTISEDLRTIKFYFVMVGLVVGIQFGQFVSGLIFTSHNYLAVYGTSTTLMLLALVGIAPFLENPVTEVSPWRKKMKDFLRMDNFKEGWKAAFSANKDRTRLLLFAACIAVILFNGELTRSITYYYMKNNFKWSVPYYSNINAAFSLMDLVCTAAIVFVGSRMYNINDLTLSIIGILSFMSSFIIKGLIGSHEWLYYLSCVTGTVTNVSPVAISAYISKNIEPDKATKIFSFWSSCESLVPLLGNVFSRLLYSEVADKNSAALQGLPYLIGAGFLLVPLFITMYYIRKDSRNTSSNYGDYGGQAALQRADCVHEPRKGSISVISGNGHVVGNGNVYDWTPGSSCNA